MNDPNMIWRRARLRERFRPNPFGILLGDPPPPRGPFKPLTVALSADKKLPPGEAHKASTYRPDIDGLRAIAVFGVILMHAGVTAISGGFLGVDVFFVISGYLVHQQVTSRLANGTFSLSGFYGRRVRRTFPALYVVAAVSLGTGAVLLMPGDFDALARSAVAAALGVSNIFFATQTGYFDHSALTKPLLHSWSLGVEEQFYLIAPLIPFALGPLSSTLRRRLLFGLLAVDLAFCVVMQRLIPDITFFMMPPRLWEFLIGSLVAEGFLPNLKRQWCAELLGALALLALLGSMVAITAADPHPGLATLVPCLATGLLIHLGGTSPSRANRLLGLTPLAFLGLISYSLYLWHWPMIVYARYANLAMTPAVLGLGAALLLALSVLSWKFIETPFRTPASALRRNAVPILLSGLSGLAAAAAVVIGWRGLPERFSPDVAAITAYYDYADRRNFREGTCFLTTKYSNIADFDRTQCLALSPTQPNYLLIGDSHAAHYWAGFSRVFTKVHVLQATASGCTPLLGTPGKSYCTDLMHEALTDFLPKAKLDGVILAAAWDDADVPLLPATIAYAKKFVPHVILLGSIPTHEIDLPNLLGRSLVTHRPELVLENQSAYPWHIDQLFERAIGRTNYVSMADLLCPAHRCIVYAAHDVPLQFDTSHLTTEGSVLVARKLATLPVFAPLVDGRENRPERRLANHVATSGR